MSDQSTVAAIVADALARADVPRVFAAGGASTVLCDAISARGLPIVGAAGATAACIMAAVTAELGAAPGVAVVSLGADVAPVVDGVAHATRDRAGLIVISEGGPQSRLLEPVVKASVAIEPASAAHWIAHAVQAAMAHPRGAVHLAIPPSVVVAPAMPLATNLRPAPATVPSAEALDALGDAIAQASRPVLIAGLETTVDDAKWIRALAESLPAPVLTTPKGKGAVPDPHPLALGMLASDHPLLAQSDLIISLGVDPIEVPPRVWPAGVARVAVCRAPQETAGRGPHATVSRAPQEHAIICDIGPVLEELAPRLRGRMQADWDVAALDRIKRVLTASAARPVLTRRRVVELARQATPAGTILALDVPLASAWSSVARRECLIPNGVATHGFALPAAIAAALARSDARVGVARDDVRAGVARDGARVVAIGSAAGFEAMAGEWRTAARLGVRIVAVTLNDAGALDVSRAAEAAGVDVLSAHNEPGFAAVFERAWRASRTVLIDAHVK